MNKEPLINDNGLRGFSWWMAIMNVGYFWTHGDTDPYGSLWCFVVTILLIWLLHIDIERKQAPTTTGAPAPTPEP